MRIHIARDGQALGVLSLEDLNRELADGRIVATDLAWYEGASGWVPVGQVPGVVAPQRTVWTPPAAELAEQPEAAAALGELGYAGFWKRFAARIIDVFVCMLIAVPIGVVLGVAAGAGGHAAQAESVTNLVGMLITWLYFALQESSGQQATLGKRALGIIVCDRDGRRISFARACGRHFAAVLNYLPTFGFGWIMAGFTARKQGLHDLIAGTLVLNREPDAKALPVWAILLLALVLAIAPLGILAAIAIPAYSDFTNRSKVFDAVSSAAAAKIAIVDYYREHDALPATLEAAGTTTASESAHVSAFALEDGVLLVRMKSGQAVALEPYRDATGQITWRCGKAAAPAEATDIAAGDSAALTTVRERYLPTTCQPPKG
jgi:uncharacterized RDD family membrane protein YckC/type II secretory pathway pseudopilin PulG